MKKRCRTGVYVVLVLILMMLPHTTAQMGGIEYSYGAGIATLTTNEIGVRISASNQVPHFWWWNRSAPEKNYHLQFLKLIEVQDLDEDGLFDPSTDMIVGIPFILPGMNWDFSGFYTQEEDSIVKSVHFNLSTTASFSIPIPTTTPITTVPTTPSQIEFDVEIQIHVSINASNPNELKFGVSLSGWQWRYDDSILVFQFVISESDQEAGDKEPPSRFEQQDNLFEFGPSYIEFAEEAYAGTSTVAVGGSYGSGTDGEEGQSVYLSFEHFGNNSLFYDPIVGMSGPSPDPNGNGDETGNGYGIDYQQLALIVGSISVVTLVLILIENRRR